MTYSTSRHSDGHQTHRDSIVLKARFPLRLVRSTLLTIALTLSSQAARAAEPVHADLVTIIQAIETGWEQADGTPFRKHFRDSETARYVEGGGQNTGLSDLIDHHVEPEGDALEGLDLTFSNIETHSEGSFAWAIADVEVVATIRSDGRKLHNRGYETFLFRQIDGDWKVIHTHSSSRPVKAVEPPHDH